MFHNSTTKFPSYSVIHSSKYQNRIYSNTFNLSFGFFTKPLLNQTKFTAPIRFFQTTTNRISSNYLIHYLFPVPSIISKHIISKQNFRNLDITILILNALLIRFSYFIINRILLIGNHISYGFHQALPNRIQIQSHH